MGQRIDDLRKWRTCVFEAVAEMPDFDMQTLQGTLAMIDGEIAATADDDQRPLTQDDILDVVLRNERKGGPGTFMHEVQQSVEGKG